MSGNRPPRDRRRATPQPVPAAKPTAASGGPRSGLLIGAVAVVIVGAAALAILLGGGLTGGGASPAVSGSAGASAAAAASSSAAAASAPGSASSASASSASAASASAPASAGTSNAAPGEPVITGSPLPQLPASGADPAKGMTAPTVQGASFDGSAVAIQPSGRPSAIMFIAHWCPHCQREVPLIQSWINANGMPAGVDLISVATGIDPTRPNYPPDAWLAKEGWTVPVLVDPSNTVAQAFGITGYPFWVFLDGQGKVVARMGGEMTIAQLVATLATLTGG